MCRLAAFRSRRPAAAIKNAAGAAGWNPALWLNRILAGLRSFVLSGRTAEKVTQASAVNN
jgi:hypothetical protein